MHSNDFLISVFLIQLAIAVIAAISSKLSVLLFLFGFLSSGSLEANSQWRSFASANAIIRRLFCFLCSFLKASQRVSTIDLTSKKFISVVLNFTSFASHHTTTSRASSLVGITNHKKIKLILPFFIRITRRIGLIDLFSPPFFSVPFSPSIKSRDFGKARSFRLIQLSTQAVYFRLYGTKRKNLPPLEPLVGHLAHHQRSFLQSLFYDSQALEL